METKEAVEKTNKKLNIVIMGFGELGEGFYKMLKETNSNVYVVSVSGKNSKQYENAGIAPYNRYEGFPIAYDDIDAVLLCCRTDQLELVKELIPKEILPKLVDKLISFQNGFDVRETLIRLFGKSVPRCVPYLSFKRCDGKKITLKFARTSPIKGSELGTISDLLDSLNAYTSEKFGAYLFEGVNSIALQRDGEFKAIINTILNSLCVVYHGNVERAVSKFNKEFGPDAIARWSKEISDIENVVYADSCFEINPGEVEYRINQVIQKFAKEKPSTYQQYYTNAAQRGGVISEDNHLLGYIVDKAKRHDIAAPISNQIWNKLKLIEKEINQKFAKN